MLGKTLVPDSDRHKSDALGFYIKEIHWFNLIFVTGTIHAMSLQTNLQPTNKTSEPMKLVYSGIMIFSRLLQLYFLMPLYDYKRRYLRKDKRIWIIFGVIEVIGLGITATFSSYRGITAATSIVELFVFCGQFLYSYINVRIQESGGMED